MTDRSLWRDYLRRIAQPVLAAAAAGRLAELIPVEVNPTAGNPADRRRYAPLEALGRTLAGLAPWLETAEAPDLAEQARQAIARAPATCNFTDGAQPLVDAAFLAHALLRAPRQLWQRLPATAQQDLIAALQATRRIEPYPNNWLLFAAIIETFLERVTGHCDPDRRERALAAHRQWYLGDGHYGDGPEFHWDYYNSFVIQPMLLDAGHPAEWLPRAQRYAVVLERLIAPDGTFPAIGRSIAYRTAAFQLLAQLALQQTLPAQLPPGQVRAALTAVIRRCFDAPGTFDDHGWLRIGLAGHQPHLAEPYISTGSLYLCTTVFLPLGLPATAEFWTAPALPWTSRRIWNGEDLPADSALKGK